MHNSLHMGKFAFLFIIVLNSSSSSSSMHFALKRFTQVAIFSSRRHLKYLWLIRLLSVPDAYWTRLRWGRYSEIMIMIHLSPGRPRVIDFRTVMIASTRKQKASDFCQDCISTAIAFICTCAVLPSHRTESITR